jgi:hypothetical protein
MLLIVGNSEHTKGHTRHEPHPYLATECDGIGDRSLRIRWNSSLSMGDHNVASKFVIPYSSTLHPLSRNGS